MRKEGPLEKETIKSVVIKPNMGKYDDIINLEHHVSKNHKQMSIYDRSAQFAPFAALVGYDESINEAGRFVEQKSELSSDKIIEISNILNYIQQNISSKIDVNIIYFKKDKTKDGGKYLSISGVVSNINASTKSITIDNKNKINFDDIIDISLPESF